MIFAHHLGVFLVARDFGKKLVTLAMVAAVFVALVVAALNPGVRAAEVKLNDGGVWVTNARLQLVAHLNYASHTFDSALRMPTKEIDVFQDGEHVYVSDMTSSVLSGVDVARTALGLSVTNPGLVSIVGGGVAAFADVTTGNVWRQHAGELTAVDTSESPAISDMPDMELAVGGDGTLHVASAQRGSIVSLPATADSDDAKTRALNGVSGNADLQLAAIGDKVVVLDRTTRTLFLPSGEMVIDGEGLQLQENGAASDVVVVASNEGLIEVPLSGGTPRIKAVSLVGGAAVRPARLGQCSYGAWTGTGAFLRACEQEADNIDMRVDSLTQARQTQFRVNRSTIVLNDIESGTLWLPDEKMLLVDNWDQVDSTMESDTESEEESADKTNEVAQPERSEENTPPVAVDDTFGVRAGRSNVLPVLQNDTDIDGDYMTVTKVGQTSLGELSVTREGGALHIVVPSTATGSSVFEYEISDGRGGSATAKVTLTVHDSSINSAPVQVTAQALSLGEGRSASVNTLANWYDPDGDPFYLAGVRAPEGLSVRYRETGTVDVTANGHPAGENTIGLSVSDGRDVGEGRIDVTVKGDTNAAPVTNTDHLVVKVGQTATISPMDNDTDPNGDPLRLVQVDPVDEGLSVSMDGALGTIDVTGHQVGSYYLSYAITDGPATTRGFIRVDVFESDSATPPTAEDDIGVLPAVGQVLVNLLANDYDPAGGILTVQQIDLPANSPLRVALLDRQVARIIAPQGLSIPETFSYVVTNGSQQARASVTVIPGPPINTSAPPELTDDTLVVRAGDVASVSVLANDRSPAGLSMTVSNELQHTISPDVASVFISDNVIRVRGGANAGSGSIIYTVTDSAGNVASAKVDVTVLPLDEQNNTPPRPRNLVARTAAGQSVPIVVPLEGIDREGDSVTLLGIATSPKLGTVETQGNRFTYTAGPTASGTDTFTYVVEDHLGKQATGTVRVGISPPTDINQNPVALPDEVHVRPGTRVSVAVLTNDVDPDGDRLTLSPESLDDKGAGMNLSDNRGRIILTAPANTGIFLVTYGVSDGAGGYGEGLLRVTVANDAPRLAPIARDDALTEEQLAIARKEGKITLQVLSNDDDPDGDIFEAKVTSEDSTMRSLGGGEVEITLTPQPQVLIYTVTDATGLSASAAIRVPGTELTRPYLDATTVPVRVKAGERIDILINDHVKARDGRQVILTSEGTVSVGAGSDGSSLVKDRLTLTFKSTPEFYGRTSLTFEVTDGENLNDFTGRTALISLPIEVESTGNQPPQLRPTPISVIRGGEAVTADLLQMSSDPDADSTLAFDIVGSTPAGISASISGSHLNVQAGEEAALGDTQRVMVRVTDQEGASHEAAVPIVVKDNVMSLIQTSEARVSVEPGASTNVDIRQYATNTDPNAGQMRIVGTPTASEGGRATASGTVVTVSANPNYSGTFTVTYTVVDGDGKPERQVTGLITVSVRAAPASPQGVSAQATSSSSVEVQWAPSRANGAPITNYTVTDHTQGDSQQCGVVTRCLLNNRTKGVTHEFSVTATNEVGTSDPSERVRVSLDTAPPAPATPSVVAGNGTVTVTWMPPTHDGSAIRSYEVLLSPGSAVTVTASGTGEQRYVASGLANGTEYTAQVRAINAEGASPWSPLSPGVRPYGPPGQITSFNALVSSLAPGASTAQVTLTWAAPNDNGRPIEYYTVSGAGVTKQVTAGHTTSTVIEGVPVSDTPVTFTVTATNDSSQAATYTSVPAQTSIQVVGRPNAPTLSSVSPTGVDNQIRVTWSPSAAGNGWTPSDLRYEWTIGGSWYPLQGDTITGNGLANGQQVTIRLRAVGIKAGNPVYSTEVASNVVTPYGQPVAPSVSCVGGHRSVTCHWHSGSGNGLPATFWLEGPDSGWVEASGRRTYSASPGQEVRICVKTVQGTTNTHAPTCASAKAFEEHITPVRVERNGMDVKLTMTHFHWAGYYMLRCWNADEPEDAHYWNFLGQTAPIAIPKDGTVSFRCPGNPENPGLQPDEDFSVEFHPYGGWYR
ncbi:Ig-like domain-containing protein [Schaalia suimastitidis]|uniref:Ig-like domain-containing protein n=1 Tax=Schaalia suimastitidis TaxID=121163 RepID=UPI000426CC4B|nr:Ig-like domain-containing protein [Schaalia suimastitidis]